MTDLDVYIIFLSAFVITFTIIITANNKLCHWLITLLKTLLILQISFYCIRIACLPFPKNEQLATILYLSDITIHTFYAATFISYFIIKLLFNKRLTVFHDLLLQNIPVLYKILRLSAASVFFYSSVFNILHPAKGMEFFTLSGYSHAFYVFITIVELTGAVGLLFRKTVLYATLLLMCDMLGATGTHYYNYFTKHLPGPLGNSIPSLILQTVLISILIITVRYSASKPETAI